MVFWVRYGSAHVGTANHRDEIRECAKIKREQTKQKLKENRAVKHKQKEGNNWMYYDFN
jgi:hypothetical protein